MMQAKLGKRGVTLIEILVTMVISGIVLIGLGTLFSSATGDYAELARNREERYSRELLETEMLWRLKAVPGEFIPTLAQFNTQKITWNDERTGAAVIGDVLSYDYMFDDQRTTFNMGAPIITAVPVAGGGCTVDVPRGVRLMTGMIFQWHSVVYVVEREVVASWNTSFRNMPSPQGYISSLFTGAPPAVPTPLGIGVRSLRFNIIDPAPGCDNQRNRRVEWTLEQWI